MGCIAIRLAFIGRQDGLDLADKAAAQGVRSIIMSGAMDRREEVEALGLRFLPKPFRYATLLTAIGSDADGNALRKPH